MMAGSLHLGAWRGVGMLGLAIRYLVVAVVAGALFATLQGRSVPVELTARQIDNGHNDRADRGRTSHPDREEDSDGGDLEQIIEAGPHGHFLLEAVVNGVPVDFMVDTGASDVVLTLADARRLGFEPGSLRFTEQFQSANGTVPGAPVELRELRIGQFRLFDLEASVSGGALPISLLGMSFLQRLNSYEVAGDRLVLRW